MNEKKLLDSYRTLLSELKQGSMRVLSEKDETITEQREALAIARNAWDDLEEEGTRDELFEAGQALDRAWEDYSAEQIDLAYLAGMRDMLKLSQSITDTNNRLASLSEKALQAGQTSNHVVQ